MQRAIIVLLITTLFVGCEGSSNSGHRRERGERRHRRNDDDDRSIKPSSKGSLYIAQSNQAKARAIALRELAAQTRNGMLKTIWDANKVYKDFDHVSREEFDKAVRERMEKDLKQDLTDDLPHDSDKLFEAMADDIEGK